MVLLRSASTMTDLDDLLDGLSDAQREAVLAPAPVRVIAPAGSGKTLVLTRRIAAQIRLGAVRPRTSAALTFTRAAALSLRQRLARTLDTTLPITTTIHGAALVWLSELARLEGKALPPVVESETLVRAALPNLSPAEHAAVRAALRGQRPTSPAHEAHVRAVHELRRRRRVIDLDSIVGELARQLERQPERRGLIGIEALFVDEFQDSTPDQLRLFRALLGPDLAGLTVVGDPNQSIYGWNGADPNVLTDLEPPGLRTVTLTTNYRSRDELVRHATRILDPQPHVRGARPGGRPPTLRGYATPEREARALVRELGGLHALGVAWRAMAVLSRTTRALEPVTAALEAAEIPAVVLGRTRTVSAMLARLRSLRDRRATVGHLIDELSSMQVDDPSHQHELDQVRDIAIELHRVDPLADLATFQEILEQRLARRLDAVTIATFHKAKGLEWYHVHVLGVGERALPHPRARTSAQREEERRLLYVAMTRATDSLSVSWHGGPSPFLAPIVGDRAPLRPTPSAAARGAVARQRALRHALVAQRARLARSFAIAPSMLLSDESIETFVRTPPRCADDVVAHLTRVPPARRRAVARAIWACVSAPADS